MKKIIALVVVSTIAFAGIVSASFSTQKSSLEDSIKECGFRCTLCNGSGFNGVFNCSRCNGTGRFGSY